MADGVQFQLFGDKELDEKFAELPPALQKKVLRPALRAAAKIINERAKALSPVQTGDLRRSLRVRAGKRTRKGIVTLQVVTGQGFFRGDQFYGAFVEFGHKIGKRPHGGKLRRALVKDARKEVPGKHFIEQGYNQTAELAKQKALSLILEGMISIAVSGDWPGGGDSGGDG